MVPYHCHDPMVLSYLQELLNKSKSFSTVNVYLVVISDCHAVDCLGSGGSHQHPF